MNDGLALVWRGAVAQAAAAIVDLATALNMETTAEGVAARSKPDQTALFFGAARLAKKA